MSFAPGVSGNPNGRPPKDGPKWAKLSHWFESIQKDMAGLTPLQRVETAKWAMDFLVENAKHLPVKQSAEDQAAAMLKALEENNQSTPR